MRGCHSRTTCRLASPPTNSCARLGERLPSFSGLARCESSAGSWGCEAMPVLPLLDLIASKGSTVEQLATALGFHSDLIYRVAKGRQPLPRLAAEGIALLLSVSLAEVLAGAPQWTASSDPLAFVPLPPDPALGDPFQLAPISATVLMAPL